MQPSIGEPSGPSLSDRGRIIAAARRCFAERPPVDVTVADVAAAAGVDEHVVSAMFRSRRGLERAVLDDLAETFKASSLRLRDRGPSSFASVLAERRADPVGSRLLTRCALGDLDVTQLRSVGDYVNGLVRWVEAHRGRRRGAVPMRTRLCAFGAMSTLLGWITYAQFLCSSLGVRAAEAGSVEAVVAESAALLVGAAFTTEPVLRKGMQSDSRSDAARVGDVADDVDDAGEGAGRTLEESSAIMQATFDGADWFDLAATVRLVRHDTPVARRLAAAIADAVPVESYRTEFPVLDRALGVFVARDDLRPVVTDGDHRAVFAAGVGMLLGSALWDRPLRHATGIRTDVDVDPAIVTFLRVLGGFPDPTKPLDRG